MPSQPLGISCGNRYDVEGLTTVPNVFFAMYGWFQKLSLVKVFNQTVDFETVATTLAFATDGVVVPFSVNELRIKPEGQRSWQWFALYCTDELPLKMGDTVVYKTVRYKVMNNGVYSEYGYMYYELVNVYHGGS